MFFLVISHQCTDINKVYDPTVEKFFYVYIPEEYLNSVKSNGVKARQNPRSSLTGIRRPDHLPQLKSIFPTIKF